MGAQIGMCGFGWVGAFKTVELSKVPEEELDVMVKKLCASYKLGAENVKLKCAKRQLVNGLNWRLYFTAGDKTCEVKYFSSFRGEIDDIEMKCDIEGGLKSCLSHYKTPTKSRKRRSLMSNKPRSRTLKFSKGQSYVTYLFDVYNNHYNVIKKLGGLETEGDYPYDGADEKCKLDQSKLNVYLN